jgi:hypothetical protein
VAEIVAGQEQGDVVELGRDIRAIDGWPRQLAVPTNVYRDLKIIFCVLAALYQRALTNLLLLA